MQENKAGWVIAGIVIVAVAVVAWWYVAGTPAAVEGEKVSPAAPVAGQAPAPVAAPAAADSTGAIQNELNAADSGSADLDSDIDSLGNDIEKGL